MGAGRRSQCCYPQDETGFRVVECRKRRKVVLSDSLKREIQDSKLRRELRRRGSGQHTIEKALHAHARVNSKIVAAGEDYTRHDPESKRLDIYALQESRA